MKKVKLLGGPRDGETFTVVPEFSIRTGILEVAAPVKTQVSNVAQRMISHNSIPTLVYKYFRETDTEFIYKFYTEAVE